MAFLVWASLTLRKLEKPDKANGSDIIVWIIVLCGSAAATVAIAIGWLLLMRQFPKDCIMGALVAQISLCAMLTMVCFAFNAILSGVLFMMLTMLLGMYLYGVRDCIPFAASMLTIVGSVMKQYPQAYWLAIGSLVPQLIVWGLFVCSAIVLLYGINHKDVTEQTEVKLSIFFLVFVAFWASQIIRNVVHTTVGGVTATWYFLAGPDDEGPPNPLTRSLKRSMTTSLGSISYGSLLVAFIQTLRFMVRSQDDGFCALCVDCFLSCVEGALEYMNKYAFTYIAIYGGNFCDGGQAAWNLLKERGFDLIINDDLTETVFMTASFFTAVLVGLITGVIALIFKVKGGLYLAFIGALVGFVLCALTLSVMDSGVATLFICFAEDPGQLEASRPELHAELRAAWVVRYGVEDWDVRMRSTAPARR